MFQVFDCGKPAQDEFLGDKWRNSKFSSLEDAKAYAIAYLGDYAPRNKDWNINTPYDYSGYGDILEIREIKGDQGVIFLLVLVVIWVGIVSEWDNNEIE